MKWILLAGLILFLLVMLAGRYRRQLGRAIVIWRELSGNPPELREIKSRQSKLKPESDIPLVRCLRCGDWVARTRAMKSKGDIYYCSKRCLERIPAGS